jgi:Flp pilus assembly protein TadG
MTRLFLPFRENAAFWGNGFSLRFRNGKGLAWRRPPRGDAVARPGRASPGRNQAGAVMIEFAFGLLFIFLIFIAYVKISEIFLAQSRLRYAAFVASRVHAVGGSAQNAASKIDKDFTLKKDKDSVSLEKTVKLPKAVGTLFGTGESFTINHSVKTFVETTPSGDNTTK